MRSVRQPSAFQRRRPVVFLGSAATFHADTCKPLLDAARQGHVDLNAFARRGYPGTPFPKNLLKEISSVGYWDAPRRQSWGLDWHRNEGIELTYLARGRTAFLVEGEKHQMADGQFTVTRPWQKHKLGDPNIGPTRLYWLILDVGVRRPNQAWRWPDWLMLSPADRERLTVLLSHNEQNVWAATDGIRACFERLPQYLAKTNASGVESRLRMLVNELLLCVLECLETKRVQLNAHLVSTQRAVEVFLKSLKDHPEQPWTLDTMAARCGLGRSRFAHYCRLITNMTPNAFLTQTRVQCAIEMIRRQPDRSLTDVAFACGFQSSQYFATVFRRATGGAPSEYVFRDT
jgi:AraC family L-rhamnose operon regulatory protein RhaS